MRVVIVEDEDAAVERLEGILKDIDGSIEILAVIDSVEDAVAWFGGNSEPDVLFLDVQLADGICFEIFSTVDLACAVIFTTAYDEYAIQAFKLNSIDYLIKPVDPKALRKSLAKFEKLNNGGLNSALGNIDALLDHLHPKKSAYKSRFLVKQRDSYHTIACEDILIFFTEHQLVYLLINQGKRFLLDYTLNDVEQMVDPSSYFRINRQMIVSMDAIQSIGDYFNNRLKLTLSIEHPEDIIVSRGRVNALKAWLGG